MIRRGNTEWNMQMEKKQKNGAERKGNLFSIMLSNSMSKAILKVYQNTKVRFILAQFNSK